MRQQVELLKAKLEASELKHTVNELKSVISQMQRELKESNKLLRQQRLPPRIRVSSTERMLLAQSQKWKCDGGPECPLLKLNDGLFNEGLWVVDHKIPWSRSGKHASNLHCLCPMCDSKKTRAEVAAQEYKRELTEESEEEGD